MASIIRRVQSNDETITKIVWDDMCLRLGITAFSEKWWEILTEKYDEVGRHYHTMRHIQELMKYVDYYSNLIEDKDIMILAILFHDVIYDPKSSSNEDDSIVLFREFVFDVKSVNIDAMSEEVVSYIECTKDHKIKSTDSFSKRLFSDFDMAIIGSPRTRYQQYAWQIRNEYSHVPLDTYCVRRAAFLKSCAKSVENVFSTDLFRARFEDSARDNLLWECSFLEKGLVPGHIETIIKPTVMPPWQLVYPFLPLFFLVCLSRFEK
jgi:predicted metal-dependent HD superfamily phosphohydrolase